MLESALVEVPTLIGWLRPTILVPASVFIGLTPDQLEAILAHELAHVRRYDYLVNLFQTLIETILFYHPAVWWISRKLREERENCCDDIALEVMQDRLVYASALAQLEAGRGMPLALTASGGSLLHRIRRIAGTNDRKVSAWPLWVLIIGIVSLVCLTKSNAQAPDQDKAPASAPPADVQSQMLDAVRKGDAAVVQKLIEQGANPKAIDKYGNTLLFDAGSPEMAEILVAHGVDPKIRNRSGFTALSSLCLNGGKNTAAIARVLLQNGADPNSRDGQLKTTPIMGARDGDTVDILMEYGADVNAKDSEGDSALFWATWQDVSTIQALIRHGVPFNAQKDGPTFLMYAAQHNNVPIAKWLLDHGVDPNVKGTWAKGVQTTPLQTAASDGTEDVAKLLLERGAKVTNEMVYALDTQHPRIVKLIWESGARPISELCYQVSQGATVSDVQKLLDQGIPADPPQDQQITPLSVAAGLGRMDLVQLLVQRGANANKGAPLNPKYPDYKPTPLVVSAKAGQDEIVDYLLRHGAQPTSKAVFVAAARSATIPGQRSKDHFERCVKLLIDAGALKNATPEQAGEVLDGPMLTGGMGGNATVLKMLLDAGLSPELPEPDAERRGDKKMSVLAYYQNFYSTHQNSYRFTDNLKLLLDMLKQADRIPDDPRDNFLSPSLRNE
jgi:ankyrin repeat protein